MKKRQINKILKWFKSMENEEYSFPKTKKELFELEELYLCCLCGRVPKEISQLKNLKKLSVFFYGIQGTLPKEIKYFKHLEKLSLGITDIKKIHPNLYKLKKLKENKDILIKKMELYANDIYVVPSILINVELNVDNNDELNDYKNFLLNRISLGINRFWTRYR